MDYSRSSNFWQILIKKDVYADPEVTGFLRLPEMGVERVPKSKNGLHKQIQGVFFDWSALKMTKSQPLKEFSELVLPKKRLRMKKV